MDLGLQGKVAIVTGSSDGIGYATALALAREGTRVVLCGRREPVLAEASERIARETSAELLAALKEIAALEIQSTRGTSAEFAVKRLSEVCAIARQAIAKA